MDYNGKKIGVWGLGVVGTSAINFFSGKGARLSVMNKTAPTSEQAQFLATHAVTYMPQDNVEQFFQSNDYVLTSPGIDLRGYLQFQEKFITELDIFAAHWPKKIIAITGSIGKTTTTTLLEQILQHHVPVIAGGNIGTAMLDCLDHQAEYAVLELSSFQLAYTKQFAPDIAIITNIHENHLDWHGTYQHYIDAKANIFVNQRVGQRLIISDDLATLPQLQSALAHHRGKLTIVSMREQLQKTVITAADTTLHNTKDGIIITRSNGITSTIKHPDIPPMTMLQNWLAIFATITALNFPISLEDYQLAIPEHRCEPVATINNTLFVNDSKSTIPQATIAAVNQHTGPIHLFVGGISKGIDRESMFAALPKTIAHLYCFGKEATLLHTLAMQYNFNASLHVTLEDAFNACTNAITPGCTVLFSPSGASFDLFANYVERGKRFKELVTNYEKMHLPAPVTDTSKQQSDVTQSSN